MAARGHVRRPGPRRCTRRGEEGRERVWSSKVWILERRARTTPLYETNRVAVARGLFGLIQQAQSRALGQGLQVYGEKFFNGHGLACERERLWICYPSNTIASCLFTGRALVIPPPPFRFPSLQDCSCHTCCFSHLKSVEINTNTLLIGHPFPFTAKLL